MKIKKIDILKFDPSIQYSQDCFGQRKTYQKIEEDVIGPLYVKDYLKELGNQLIEEGGFDSPEFERFEEFEEEVRNRIIKLNSKKELEVMRKAYDI